MITLHCCRCMVVWNRWFRFCFMWLLKKTKKEKFNGNSSTFQVSSSASIKTQELNRFYMCGMTLIVHYML